MNIIDRFVSWYLSKRNSMASPDPLLLRMLGGGYETKAGPVVNQITALQCSAVLACIRILAETVASLPLKVYRRLSNGGKEPAVDHPLYDVLWLNPNDEQTSMEWREQLMVDACIWGNYYGQLVFDGKGNVRQIWRLDPARVTVERPREDGPRIYRYRRQSGQERVFDEFDMLHISLLGDGLKGRSLVDLTRDTIGLAIGAEEFAARFYRNDGSPRLAIEVESNPGEKTIAQWRKSWDEIHGGSWKAHKVGWFWGGMKAKLLEADVTKTQIVEVRKFQLEEIARIFRVPLHLIQSLDRATNNNIEHQGIDFVVHTARPWLVRIEQRISKALFGPVESSRFFAEFNVDGLQRGDFRSRTEGYSRMIASAIITPNEARALENLNPIDGGDQLYIQGAMVPLSQAGARFVPQQTEKIQ